MTIYFYHEIHVGRFSMARFTLYFILSLTYT